MAAINLECKCGSVKGMAHDVSPKSGIHIVCYCDDCQAFAYRLEQQDTVLDSHRGTDIFQMSSANIELTEGLDHVRCIRMIPKGMYRFYTKCCKTPIGNTVSAKIPFVGLITAFIKDASTKETALGPVTHQILTKFAKPPLPDNKKISSSKIIVGLRILSKFLTWKIRDGRKNTVFFNADGTPNAPLKTD